MKEKFYSECAVCHQPFIDEDVIFENKLGVVHKKCLPIYQQHGFKVLKDSGDSIEATVRVGRRYKYVFSGPCTFEEKITEKYGRQCIIVVRMDKDKFPVLEETDYEIEYPRIEILIPECIAKSMRLIK